MSPKRRLTPEERFAIVRERAKGVPAAKLAARFGVSQPDDRLHPAARPRAARRQRQPHEADQRSAHRGGSFAHSTRGADPAQRGSANRRPAAPLSGSRAASSCPTDALADELRGLRRLRSAGWRAMSTRSRGGSTRPRRGACRQPYTERSDRELRALAGLIFEFADQVQDMALRSALGARPGGDGAALRELADGAG